MFYTHHFSRPETLSRACFWLMEFGIKPLQMLIDNRARRISLQVGLGDFVEVDSIINALESSELHGTPLPWDATTAGKFADADTIPAHATPASPRSPISWSRDERLPAADSGLAAMIEAMQRST